jgi:hypothetical protein
MLKILVNLKFSSGRMIIYRKDFILSSCLYIYILYGLSMHELPEVIIMLGLINVVTANKGKTNSQSAATRIFFIYLHGH